MRCIAGLGNRGKKYQLTRHNVGFLILDSFALKHKIDFFPSKRDYFYSEGSLMSSEFFLLKPTTYMNLSGTAVLDFVDEHKINFDDLLVIVDDINLEFGKIRLRKSGGDGGHNGLTSVIYHLQSEQFPRLRFGVGSQFEKGNMADYVLQNFNDDEQKQLGSKFDFAVELIENFITGGYKSMSDHFSKQSRTLNNNQDNSHKELN